MRGEGSKWTEHRGTGRGGSREHAGTNRGKNGNELSEEKGHRWTANSPTPSFHVGEEPEQRVNCPSSTNSWLQRFGW